MSSYGGENKHLKVQHYQITVLGMVDPSWSEWFSDLRLIRTVDAHGFSITRLSGVLPDQGALRGVLNRLWDLNLTLLSVRVKLYYQEVIK
jgi:hypothetical protein